MNLREMSLESKINSQFDSFLLKAPDPKQDHPWHLEHLHADFIELDIELDIVASVIKEVQNNSTDKDFAIKTALESAKQKHDNSGGE